MIDVVLDNPQHTGPEHQHQRQHQHQHYHLLLPCSQVVPAVSYGYTLLHSQQHETMLCSLMISHVLSSSKTSNKYG